MTGTEAAVSFPDYLAECGARVNRALEQRLPEAETLPVVLHQAMRYAVFNGGKRIRPTLLYAARAALGETGPVLDAPACAVELIHAYSLVHDDLPAMDDDDLRRGKPTCHRAFDEATAILTGDALQTLAFQVLAEGEEPEPARRLQMVGELARASGSRGMAGGQALDLAAVGRKPDLAELESMHIHKTGVLIRASVRLGALCVDGVAEDSLRRLDHYAKCIGLAFQIQDDVLDVTADTTTLGKPQGSDARQDKPTYPDLLGLDGARELAGELIDDALASLAPLDERAEPLRALARYIIAREH